MPDEQDKKNALAFLRKLEEDDDLSERCDGQDAQAIREIAAELSLPFTGFDIYRGTCARRAWKIARSAPARTEPQTA